MAPHLRTAVRWCLLLAVCIASNSFPAAAHAQSDERLDPDPSDARQIASDAELFGDEELDDDADLFADEGVEESGEGTEADTEEVRALTQDAANSAPDDRPDTALDALAPEAPPDSDVPSAGIEEILVQGQAGQALALDETISATSFDAADLEALGVEDLSDLAAYTPNLEIRSTGGTAAAFFIRGVGLNDFTANATGAVAIYQDDVPLNSPALWLGQIFDVEDVSVLRGPQGSGPWRNASGGAIRISSRKPTGEWSGRFRTEIGRFDGFDANSQTYEGALEVPLLADALSTRIAFSLSKQDGIVKNRCGGAPPIGLGRVTNPNIRLQPGICGENVTAGGMNLTNPAPPPSTFRVSRLEAGLPSDVNELDNWGARWQLRYVPPQQDMEFLLNLHGGRVDHQTRVGVALGTNGVRVTPDGDVTGFLGGTTGGYTQPEIKAEEQLLFEALGGLSQPTPQARNLVRGEARRIIGKRLAKRLDKKPFEGDYNRDGRETQESLGGFLRGQFEFGSVELVSITGAEYYDRRIEVDADYTPNEIFETDQTDNATQVTQDLRLSGELDALPIQWNGGAYLMWEGLEFRSVTDTASTTIAPLDRIYTQDTLAFGIHADLEWEFLDDFTLDGGFRYNWEQKKFEVHLFRSPRDVCGPPLNPLDPRATPGEDCTDRIVWRAPTGNVGLRYHFSEDVSAYWKYTRGWKSGQLNAGGANGGAFTLAEPEQLDAFEIGMGGAWFDGRVELRAAAFYYIYEDYQVFTTQNEPDTSPQRIVINASDAQIYGSELETTVTPLEGVKLIGRFAWIESEFLDFTQRVFRTTTPIPGEPPIVTPVDLDFTGNRLPNTPRFTVSGTVEYEFDLGRFGALVPRYDFAWTDDIHFDQSNGRGAPNDNGVIFMPDHAIGQRQFWTHNFRIAYRTADGNIEVAGWVRNFSNELYKRLSFDASQVGLVGAFPGDPRTFGFSVALSW